MLIYLRCAIYPMNRLSMLTASEKAKTPKGTLSGEEGKREYWRILQLNYEATKLGDLRLYH